MSEPLRIGNCSGFYGDRLSAMREMLDGGPLDVLTGDYLAELTMLILGKDTMKDPALGYARTFVRQLEDCLGTALERGVRIVANAGGLNPAGLADRVREVARGLGLDPAVAHVEGDDLRPRAGELGLGDSALTVNAYLGGWGIAAALREGADVVVTGRVTDASLVVGPAAAHHGWSETAYDALAGAVVAGHVLECGCQATGGNFSGFAELWRETEQSRGLGGHPTPRLFGNSLGFPLAEIAADGSSVITKHEGTGGLVTVDTVTAQLMYEIQGSRYLGPDVTTDLTSIRLGQVGPDRVQIRGVRGEAPPELLKVCVNELGGWRNSAELVLTGLDVEAKAAWVREQVTTALAEHRPETVAWSDLRIPPADPETEETASVLLRCTVMDADAAAVGRPFTAAVVELALASYPGFTMTAPPAAPTPYGVYRPAYVDRSVLAHTVVHADGRREVVPDPPTAVLGADDAGHSVAGGGAGEPTPSHQPLGWRGDVGEDPAEAHQPGNRSVAGGDGGEPTPSHQPLGWRHDVGEDPAEAHQPGNRSVAGGDGARADTHEPPPPAEYAGGPAPHTRRMPLGSWVHARSGDKGGDANLGLWVAHEAHAPDGEAHVPDGDARREQRTTWLLATVTPDWVRALLPEARDLDVAVHPLPELGGVNVVIHGLLGRGVAASTRFDPQAKGLGEWARARLVDIPEEIA